VTTSGADVSFKLKSDDHTSTTSSYPMPTPEQLHYMDSELTMFIHFSVCTFNEGCNGGQQNCGYERKRQPWPASSFDPTDVDTEQWAQTALDMGAKQVCLTAHHSGGFALWPTKASNYSIEASPFGKTGRDIVKEFVDSMRKHDIEPCFYIVLNMDCAETHNSVERYLEIQTQMLTELLSSYGPIPRMWWDMVSSNEAPEYNPGGFPASFRNLSAHAKALAPQTMLLPGTDGCLVGGESGSGSYPVFNFNNGTLSNTQQKHTLLTHTSTTVSSPSRAFLLISLLCGLRHVAGPTGYVRKRLFLLCGAFVSFVPSLSWQNRCVSSYEGKSENRRVFQACQKTTSAPKATPSLIFAPHEQDHTILNPGDMWWWVKGHVWFSAAQLFETYLVTIGRGNTYILNMPPNSTGLIPEYLTNESAQLGRAVKASFSPDSAVSRLVNQTVSCGLDAPALLLPAPAAGGELAFDAVVLEEDIAKGNQRIAGYQLQTCHVPGGACSEGEWLTVAGANATLPQTITLGVTIGRRVIERGFNGSNGLTIRAAALRFRCTEAFPAGVTSAFLRSFSAHKMVPPAGWPKCVN
jgi:hypothetical protein